MKERIDFKNVNPQSVNAMMQLEKHVRESGLEKSLLELIKIRVSQINGCAFCLDMHTTDARKAGETEQRIYLLNAWREATFYTDAERAALALAEAVTVISQGGVPDELYEEVRKHYNEKQFVDLLMAINVINCWNRLMIALGKTAPAEWAGAV